MFNEHAVARRVIKAAAAMSWPADRLTIQVLDDSTDGETRLLVDAVCRHIRDTTGVHCYVLRRADRQGFKAGALEEGRKDTDAEFLAIFDSDFLPPRDFLLDAVAHFYRPDGSPDTDLALVQAQWGHLNHDESWLTLAQSLWVDDHHTLQMSWRSAVWRFVNFTGTAGIWRASAVEAAGGWAAASLVEDCELSFRHLFAGYRTKFVKEIVAPAELPATYPAYKAQQKRWTQGWVQLARLHLATLLFRYRCPLRKRLHLCYHMCISWQWPAWTIWTITLPFLIYFGYWFGSANIIFGLVLYVLPSMVLTGLAAIAASIETRTGPTDADITPRTFLARLRRVVPYILINTGMLPHQFSAFCEGLFGALHSEFERTPKVASVTVAPLTFAGEETAISGRTAPADTAHDPIFTPAAAAKADRVKVHWPYVLTEVGFVAYQIIWAVVFASAGLWWCAGSAGFIAACVLAFVVPSAVEIARSTSSQRRLTIPQLHLATMDASGCRDGLIRLDSSPAFVPAGNGGLKPQPDRRRPGGDNGFEATYSSSAR